MAAAQCVPFEADDSFEAVLRMHVGDSAVDAMPAGGVAKLAAAVLGERPDKGTRAAWLAAFPPGALEWSDEFEAYYQRCHEGRARKATKHELLLDALSSAVVRGCIRRSKARRVHYVHITPFVVFRTDTADYAECVALTGTFWPIDRAAAAFAREFSCRRPDCRCWAMPCDERTLDWMRGNGVNVRPADSQ